MSDQAIENQEQRTDRLPTEEAIGDSSHPETMDTDLNDAGTAVGEPHPENRAHVARDQATAEHIDTPELDDYDEEPADDAMIAPADGG